MIKCEHCHREVKDIHNGWNKGRHHWCSKTCYEEDQGEIIMNCGRCVFHKDNISKTVSDEDKYRLCPYFNETYPKEACSEYRGEAY